MMSLFSQKKIFDLDPNSRIIVIKRYNTDLEC